MISGRYKPNDSEVASKIMDGEAILINLSNGTYYSMDKTASFIWSLISLEYDFGEILNKLNEVYDVNKDTIEKDIESLFENLINEKIIFPTDAASRTGDFDESPENADYERPELMIYNDMKDLLALDPPMPRLDDIPWQNNSEKKDK
ncbi:MAG: PqqD family protein [Ignavibacteriaceae bacterium]